MQSSGDINLKGPADWQDCSRSEDGDTRMTIAAA
jgi:hypothetical protein